jgi:hypothetical protein
MEQRRLRLGDIVDDYCPRERRVTNHAVVAMVEEDVKQTRCTTCDAEHAYKGGHAPRRRKKDSAGALYKEVLAGITDDTQPVLAAPVPHPPAEVPGNAHVSTNGGSAAHGKRVAADHAVEVPQAAAAAQPALPAPVDPDSEVDTPVEDGPVHRPLIRATLPRVEGHKEVRQATDFTIRQSNGRGANFQGHRGPDQRGPDQRARPRGGGQGQGQGQPSSRPPGGGGARFAGARPGNQGRGASGGPPGGFRAGQAPRRGGAGAPGGGGRKRSR